MSYPLNRPLYVMKPCSPKAKNKGHMAKLESILLDSSPYVGELKLDGCHYYTIEGRIFSTRISDVTGTPVEKTGQLSHISEELNNPLLKLAIFDGEVNYPGWKSQDVITVTGSLPDEAIRKQNQSGIWLRHTIFDILRDPSGTWIVDKPWKYRRKLLEDIFSAVLKDSKHLELNPLIWNNKRQFVEDVWARGGEGMVLKDINAPYVLGTNDVARPMWNWVKVKCEETDDVIITDFEPATQIYTGKDLDNWPYWEPDEANGTEIPVTRFWYNGWIGAIVFGKYNTEGKLVQLGKCSGIDDSTRKMFSERPERFIGRVIKIKAMEKTRDGAYRHPNFISLHDDKNASECRLG